MNSRSSLAYDNSYRATQPAYIPNTQSNVRIKVSTQKAVQKRTKATGMLSLFLIVGFAFIVLLRGVMITDKATNIDIKRENLNVLITSNEKLQFEIDRSLDLDNVETIARNELGMRRAEKYQTIYLNLEQTDYVEKVAKNEFAPASRFLELTSSLMAYLD